MRSSKAQLVAYVPVPLWWSVIVDPLVHKMVTFMEGDHIFHHSLLKTLGPFLEIGQNVNFSTKTAD